MTIYFVKIESGKDVYFEQRLGDHDLIPVPRLGNEGVDADIASVFLDEKVDGVFLTGFLAGDPQNLVAAP